MYRNPPQWLSALAVAAIGCLSQTVAAQVWRNDWTVTAAPSYQPDLHDPAGAAAFSNTGELVLGATTLTSSNYQLIRLTATGQLRWATNVGYFGMSPGPSIGQVLANDDGSAFAALGGFFYPGIDNVVVRVDTDGAVAWTRALPAKWLASAAPNRLAATSCQQIALLDGDSGDVVWQRAVTNGSGSCRAGGVFVDGNGNLYATFTEYVANAVVGFHTAKFDADGRLIWDTVSAGTAGASLVGLGASLVYAYTDTQLYAVRAADGSIAWSRPIDVGARVLQTADGEAEPIVVAGDSVSRVDAESGSARWTQAVSGAGVAVAVDDAVLINTSAGVLKLDAVSGVKQWTGTLPQTDSSGNPLYYSKFGGLQAGSFAVLAAAAPYSFATRMPSVQYLGFADGQSEGQAPDLAVPESVSGTSVQEDDGHVVGVAIDRSAGSLGVRVRRLDAIDGSVLWERSDPITNGRLDQLGVAIANDAVAVTLVESTGPQGQSTSIGAVWVGLHDRMTGDRRWDRVLPQFYQGDVYLSAPVADADGNIVVAVGGTVQCTSLLTQCPYQTIYKLSAVDGSVLWQADNLLFENATQALPQTFAMLGSDVLVVGPFSGPLADSTLVRLSGADGSVVWTSNVFAPYVGQIFPVDDGNVIVTGNGRAKLDGATGATLWLNGPPVLDCVAECQVGRAIVLPGGDMLAGGMDDQRPWITRFHGDGSGIVDSWHLGLRDPLTKLSITKIQRGPDGRIWLGLSRAFPDVFFERVTYLGEFDIGSGVLLSQQALDAYQSDPFSSSLGIDFLAPPSDGRLLVSTASSQHPALPATVGNASFDTAIRTTGDLSTELTFDRNHVMPGDRVAFRLIARYSGDMPSGTVALFARLPWPSGIEGLACSTQAAGNCLVDGASGNVHASFDMQPGGEVDITGRVQVLDINANLLRAPYAQIRGPTDLSEPETGNNFTSTSVLQSLFYDGFEQDQLRR